MNITRRQLLAASVPAALSVWALTACSGTPQTSSSGEGGPATAPLLRIGSLQEPTSYDPAQANEGHLAPVYQAVYDTLIKRQPDGSLAPMLATSWEASDGNKTYTLKLRSGVTFTDGTPFDSAAVKANLEHFKAANGPLASLGKGIQTVETPDASTAILRLSAPDPALPYSLTNAVGYMGSPKALSTPGIKTQPVGSGPYTLDAANTVAGSKITLVRNPNYWGDKLPFDKIEFQILTDETARLNALKSGQIDAGVLNRPASANDADAAGLQHKPFEINWEGIFFFDRDGKKMPQLADVRVRQALTYAIDRQTILQNVYLGKGTLTSQTFRPGTNGYDASLENVYQYNPDKAKQLLKDAGAENLAVTLPVTQVFDPAVYDAIEQNWKDIGVKVTRLQWGPGQPIPAMQRGDVAISYMSLSQSNDWRHIAFELAPNAPWNPFKTERPELNALIAKAQGGDDKTRADADKQINKYIVDNYWFSPLYRPQASFYWNKSVDVQTQAEQAVPSIYNYKPTGQ
jgi:peptide/nickel transport system substrate-binding protein